MAHFDDHIPQIILALSTPATGPILQVHLQVRPLRASLPLKADDMALLTRTHQDLHRVKVDYSMIEETCRDAVPRLCLHDLAASLMVTTYPLHAHLNAHHIIMILCMVDARKVQVETGQMQSLGDDRMKDVAKLLIDLR